MGFTEAPGGVVRWQRGPDHERAHSSALVGADGGTDGLAPSRAESTARDEWVEVGVAQQCSLRVDPGRRSPPRPTLDHHALPTALLERPVVVAAEERKIAEIGPAPWAPAHDVMSLAPRRWAV